MCENGGCREAAPNFSWKKQAKIYCRLVYDMAVIIIAIIIILILLRIIYELHTIKVRSYEIRDEKVTDKEGLSFVFISDLHHRRYGEDNCKLTELIRAEKPDLIFLGGDMTISKQGRNEDMLFSLLEQISKIAPVYYAPGNHERELMEYPEEFPGRFEGIMSACKTNGVRYMSNEKAELKEGFTLYAFDPEYIYYDKKNPPEMTEDYIKDKLNIEEKTSYNILLSHNPKYFEEYVKCDFDLVLSGHIHGGALRFGRTGVISPSFRFFPKYSFGRYDNENTTMIVTAGAGTHTINARLFNLPEIVSIKINGVN